MVGRYLHAERGMGVGLMMGFKKALGELRVEAPSPPINKIPSQMH